MRQDEQFYWSCRLQHKMEADVVFRKVICLFHFFPRIIYFFFFFPNSLVYWSKMAYCSRIYLLIFNALLNMSRGMYISIYFNVLTNI